jgi:biopolymer transport protein ExbD
MNRTKRNLVWKHLKAKRRLRQSDFNVRPIMNLLMLLVPLLLMYASFGELSILHSTITDQGGRTSDEIRPGLMVEIDPAGYTLFSKTCDLKQLLEKQVKVAGESKMRIEGRNYSELTRLLIGIKEFFPKENEISLIPLRSTPYQDVIHTMDTVREFQVGNVIKPLFPNIAFLQPRSSTADQQPEEKQK